MYFLLTYLLTYFLICIEQVRKMSRIVGFAFSRGEVSRDGIQPPGLRLGVEYNWYTSLLLVGQMESHNALSQTASRPKPSQRMNGVGILQTVLVGSG